MVPRKPHSQRGYLGEEFELGKFHSIALFAFGTAKAALFPSIWFPMQWSHRHLSLLHACREGRGVFRFKVVLHLRFEFQ